MILQIILRVDGNIVIQNVDGILGAFVRGILLVPGDNDIRHAVPQIGGAARVPFAHLVGQLHVRLIALVVLVQLGEFLGDDELADVHAVAQQVGDHLLGIPDGAVLVAMDQQLLQARVNQVGHQRTVVATDRLDACNSDEKSFCPTIKNINQSNKDSINQPVSQAIHPSIYQPIKKVQTQSINQTNGANRLTRLKKVSA